ncbi:hypothetical protein HDU91_004141 [Kappamyces sp. JEL0680]|nr:hypothetical protein HDU91_004141 [Kappamyces sp. JEL0680]
MPPQVGGTRLTVDPYIFDEIDPSQCLAIESSLWELEILKRHYLPQVAQFAGVFEESLAKPSYDLEKFWDSSYRSLVESELEDASL